MPKAERLSKKRTVGREAKLFNFSVTGFQKKFFNFIFWTMVDGRFDTSRFDTN